MQTGQYVTMGPRAEKGLQTEKGTLGWTGNWGVNRRLRKLKTKPGTGEDIGAQLLGIMTVNLQKIIHLKMLQLNLCIWSAYICNECREICIFMFWDDFNVL